MSLLLRRGTVDDLEAVIELRRDSYPGQIDAEILRQRFTQDPRFSLARDLFVAETDGRIVASLLGLPLQCYLPGGVKLPLFGVASVAVHPLARRKGVGRQLVAEALRTGQQKGFSAASLFAFEYAFYVKLGFAPVARAQIFRFAPAALPCFAERERVVSLSPSDWPRLAACYERHEESLGRFALARNEATWQRWLHPRQLRIYGYQAEDGGLEGYCLFEYLPLPELPLTCTLKVVEWVATSAAGWRGLLGFLHMLQEQVIAIDFPSGHDDCSPLLLNEPIQASSRMVRGEDYTVGETTVGMALRWLDPVECLRARSYPSLDVEMVMRVLDSVLGDRIVFFSLESGKPTARAATSEEEPQWEATVGYWAQIWSGAVPSSQALRWGRLQGDAAAVSLLDQAFAGVAPFTHQLDAY